MPSITVSRKEFLLGINKEMTDQEAEEVLFDFGLELDEVNEEEETYKIDIPANRYDLLCNQGLINGVSAYLQSMPQKQITVVKNNVKVEGTPPAQRPWLKMAVLKGVDLSNGRYQDLIDFQDKLHQGLGQNRALMAIGTYDYDTTVQPYTYTEEAEEEVSFVPLNQSKKYTRKELDTLYKHDTKLREYLFLGRKDGKIPVLRDSAGTILSVPPLINSERTKISPHTKNVLIDVSGTDLPRVCTAMRLLVHHFSGPDTQIEEFDTGMEDAERKPLEISRNYLEKELLLSIRVDEAQKYLERMLHRTEVLSTEDNWTLAVYPSLLRPDILHSCDLIEDIAIAHGYNNFPRLLSPVYSVGKAHPLNKSAQNLRRECAMVGYTEVFTMGLLSKNDCFGFGMAKHIQVKNPKSTECEVLRQALAPSLLKCVFANQHHQLPIKLFEVSDVGVFEQNDVGVRNDKRLCMAIAGTASGLEDLQDAFDVVMKRAGFSPEYREEGTAPFLPQRSCAVLVKGRVVGHLGIVDPSILVHHKLPLVCSLVEISLTSLYE
ncbi:phenylalanyl-tRNA synthetase beta chain [Nematocida sp. AWRm77]|nr:phenylalanyl-tRNA synthetase beta chain [Nematocida sp. AWRm77]